jgi:hypothetical protein
MARAKFHKNQRVYVRPVGTWALIERVVPHWTKGLEEPLRIHYDVGLGREFGADELNGEATEPQAGEDEERWHVVRAPNKWQSTTETATHPYPGTHPVVVTSDAEWGGWRVPGAEYAVSPDRIEKQARMIASTPILANLVRGIAEWASTETVPPSLLEIVGECKDMVRYLDSQTT